MTLTTDDLTILRKPFQPRDHEFKGKFAYIDEAEMATRIEEVDPAWTLEVISNALRTDDIQTQAVCHIRLTIKGVTKDGIGMQTYIPDREGKPQATELEKGAATDAFRRAARLFGIGRYLLKAPSTVKDVETLAAWLIANFAKPVNGSSEPEKKDEPAAPKQNPFKSMATTRRRLPADE